MKTKAYVRFLNSMATFDYDIDLLDEFSGRQLTNADISAKHVKLKKLNLNQAEFKNRTNHLKSTFYDGIVKCYYESMMTYFLDVVNDVLRTGIFVDKLVGSDARTMSEKEILHCGSWDGVCSAIAANYVRALDNLRDSEKSIKKFIGCLELNVSRNNLARILPWCEIRHLLVHRGGICDKRFHQKFGSMFPCQPGEQFILGYRAITNLRNDVLGFISVVDSEIIAKKRVDPSYCQP